jgi:hypothetical protein
MSSLCPIAMSSVVSITKDQISSNLGDEEVILHFPSGTYYGLDEVGARVWQLMQEPKSVSQIRDVLLVEYEVEPKQCEQDLLALLQKLAGENLIEITDEILV